MYQIPHSIIQHNATRLALHSTCFPDFDTYRPVVRRERNNAETERDRRREKKESQTDGKKEREA